MIKTLDFIIIFKIKIKFSIIEDYMNIVVKGIIKYVDDNNMFKTSASFIEQNNLKEPMIEEFKKYYTKADEATINEIFYNQNNLKKVLLLNLHNILNYLLYFEHYIHLKDL